jgi:hypothetical protein
LVCLRLERSAGRVAQYFEPEDKVSFLRDYCELRDLSMNQVVAIGDGRSDLPMFGAAGFSVGLILHRLRARRHRYQWTVIRFSTHCAPSPAYSTTDVDHRTTSSLLADHHLARHRLSGRHPEKKLPRGPVLSRRWVPALERLIAGSSSEAHIRGSA